jgi:hypothetical protein
MWPLGVACAKYLLIDMNGHDASVQTCSLSAEHTTNKMMGSSELIVVVFYWVSFVAMVPQYVYLSCAQSSGSFCLGNSRVVVLSSVFLYADYATCSAELVQLRRHEEDRQRLLELMAQSLCRNSGDCTKLNTFCFHCLGRGRRNL